MNLTEGELEVLWVFDHYREWVKTLDAKRQVAAKLWEATGNERLAAFLFGELFAEQPCESLNVTAFIGLQRLNLVRA